METALIRRCDIFINMFEQKVAKVQQEINALREMEKLYNIASDVVNKWSIENDVKVELHNSCVIISIVGVSTDSFKIIAKLAQSLHDKFVELELKTPEVYDNPTQISFYWSFIYKDSQSLQKYRSINLSYVVPEEGNLDLCWKKTMKSYQYEDKELVTRNATARKSINVEF